MELKEEKKSTLFEHLTVIALQIVYANTEKKLQMSIKLIAI